MRPADDPSWSDYPDTILEFFRDPEDAEPALRMDLRQPVDAAARTGLAELGLAGPFAVITAAAPRGRDVAETFDRARQVELDEEAQAAAGGITRRVDGVSPDGRHRERSVAVPVTREHAVELGRRWQQSAIFWWDGERFWLLGAEVKAEGIRLGEEKGQEGTGRRRG